MDTHDQGFPGARARTPADRTGRLVEWSVVGQNAATVRRIRFSMLPQLAGTFDVVVLLAGVNDVLTRRSPQEWQKDLAAIVRELGSRAGQVVVAGIPPFADFPSVPGLLGRYLSARAAALDEVSRRVCAAADGSATWVDARSLLPVGPGFFSPRPVPPFGRGVRTLGRRGGGPRAVDNLTRGGITECQQIQHTVHRPRTGK